MKSMFNILAIGVLFLFANSAFAADRVSVKGYTRKDRTYVAPYTRSAPGSGPINQPKSPVTASGLTSRLNPARGSGGIPTQAPSGQAKAQAQPAPRPTQAPDETARKLLEFQERRAEEGSAAAQYDLGMRYLKGEGVNLSSWRNEAKHQLCWAFAIMCSK